MHKSQRVKILSTVKIVRVIEHKCVCMQVLQSMRVTERMREYLNRMGT